MNAFSFVFLMTSLVSVMAFGSSEASRSEIKWISEKVQLNSEIRVEADVKPGVDRLYLPQGDSLEVPSRQSAHPDVKEFDKLGAADQKALHQTRRDILLAATRMLFAKRLSSVSVVDGERAVHLVPEAKSVEAAQLQALHPIEDSLGVDPSEPKAGKVKQFLRFLNEAILLSTYEAAKSNWANRHALRGLTNEFGLQITLKAEFQLGIGRYNVLKNLPLMLSFGYRRDTREVMIRGGTRQEVMSGGTAISAGVKIEIRHYRRISGGDKGALQVEGISWYPPALPMISAVADSSPTYRSSGLVFGLNLADLIPGLYFVNTVNQFSDKEVFVRALRLPSLRAWIQQSRSRLQQWRAPAILAPVACRAVFAG